jgi:hypothetical protein
MAIDHKEISKWLFDKEVEFESLDTFKEELSKRYVSREVAADDEEIRNKVTGKTLGTLETKFKRQFGLTEEEVKGKKLSELFEIAEGKQKGLIEDLQAQIKEPGQTPEEIKELKAQLEEAKKRSKEQETLAGELTKKLQESEGEFNTRINKHMADMELAKVKSSIQWADSANQYAKKGFEIDIAEKFNFVLSDGKLIATDKEGNQIKNEKGTGYMTPEEILTSEANKAGLIKKAGEAGPKVVTTNASVQTNTGQGGGGQRRFIHPRAQGHQETLAAAKAK